MSEATSPRRVLHLIVEGFPPGRLPELTQSSAETTDVIEVFQLAESNAREALEKIFTADTVAVWGAL